MDEKRITLPKENVIKLILEDEGWVCLRPSGTEPKLKIYVGIKASDLEQGEDILSGIMSWMENRVKDI